MSVDKIFGFAAATLVAIGLLLAFLFIGTPGHARVIALDEQRARDLEVIATNLHNEYSDPPAALPAVLPERLQRLDPSTKRPYEFRRLSATNFVLCAVFGAPSQRDDTSAAAYGDPYDGRAWRHGAGRTCYKLSVKGSIDPKVL